MKIITLLLSLLISATALAQEVPNDETAEWSVSLSRAEDCSDCAMNQYVLDIRALGSGRAHELVLESRADVIESIGIYKSFAIVSGPLTHGGAVASILDLNTDEKVAEIYGYGIHMSPDKRYMLYRKWFPRFAGDPTTRIMIYDIEINNTDSRNIFSNTAPERVGFELHPKESVPVGESSTYDVDHVVWRPDLKRLFTTVIDKDGYQNLLSVELWEEPLVNDQIEACYIPLVPRANSAEHAAEDSRYLVESISVIDLFSVQVEMYRSNSVKASFKIDYLEGCR